MTPKSSKNQPKLALAAMPISSAIPNTRPGNVTGSAWLLTQGSKPGESEINEVKRRRQGTSAGPTAGERAEAPVRRRPGQLGGGKQSEGGNGGQIPSGLPSMSSGGGLPGGKSLPIWVIIVIIVVYFGIRLLSPGGQDTVIPDSTPVVQDTALSESLPTKVAAKPPATQKPLVGSSTRQTWLVMMYQDGDDPILEEDIFLDFNEAERIGSSDRVQVVSQFDRYKGGYQGGGNWAGARRYYLTQDDDLESIHSKMVGDLGEVNMADGKTLVDFVTWAVQSYPADKYVLILSDHGMGWPGGWTDSDNGGRDKSSIPIASAVPDELLLMEMDNSLTDIRRQTGIDQFELIGMDACLMGQLEVFTMLASHARYAVASQETEPALGWAYTGFLEGLVQNPDSDGANLGQLIVQTYITDDQRIVDDQARADFLRQGSPLGGLFGSSGGMSADQLASQIERSVTMTAVDLSLIPALNQTVNTFAYVLQDEDQSIIARSRTYAQSFTSVWGKDVPPSYIDLGNFAALLNKESTNSTVIQAAQGVIDSMNKAIIAEKHGRSKPGATGITIYFPNSTLYSNAIAGAKSYVPVAKNFAGQSLWDEFLAFHYAGRPFEPTSVKSVIPESGYSTRAPGAGEISTSPITLSGSEAAPGQPVSLSTDIRGKNIGYIYLFVGYYDQASNSIFVADTDYLDSSTTREVGGVYYPKWSENFTMKLSWDPTVFAISDGDKTFVALFNPLQYGASAEDAIYTVDGMYASADGSAARYARLFFRDGNLRQVFGFTGQTATGAMHEITPKTGDTFTILEKWLDLDASGNIADTAYQDGDTLTFGEQMFTLKEIYAAAGEYLVGFIVTDLDGNSQEVYERVTVR